MKKSDLMWLNLSKIRFLLIDILENALLILMGQLLSMQKQYITISETLIPSVLNIISF